ncbi:MULTISPECIES: hypothetical protein [unclassified Streptomyces]|uniref:Uncharacterized protein n=1 Tax=Streptomyces sp. R33 TaxID=3238629 RepID=A0AB39YBR9_9ACTN|nr:MULTISPECIES: hypothetical protein [unclassified Streptomyces]KJY44529.1 hypothetical protein VR46_19980 [Streptomyces sp. NRRL S-444]KOY59383.1 hypothetical protein ADK59_03800 [Streptomyces sp. XY332]TDU78597.1 hypothetical protein EDD91_5387 [Streptomyces sp. KS 21]THA38761.1 hypothetical protein E6W17_14265 [Streptomyces sp. A1547]
MTSTDGFGYENAADTQPEFERLLGDCARMAPHWTVPAHPRPTRVAPSQIHGISVPPASARLIASTAEYGE